MYKLWSKTAKMLLQRKSLAFVAPSGEKYLILFFTSQSAIGYSKENLKIHTGVSGLPYPSLPFFPSLSPFSSLPPSFRSRAP